MINIYENSNRGIGSGNRAADTPFTPRERFVTGVYASVDDATARALDRLRRNHGLVPTCAVGCCHCCRHFILTNPAEIHTLAQYVRREWPAEQIERLRMRTRRWHAWDNSRPGRDPSVRTEWLDDFTQYEHCCPLLVNRTCSVYPVRPVVCRTHFVSSPAAACRASNDPQSAQDPPQVLTSLLTAARPFVTAMGDYIETAGMDFSRSIMLLPHGLAIEMGWDFAIHD